VPADVWLPLFGSAEREIDILDDSGLFIAEMPGVLAMLTDRARAGVRVRICVRDPDAPGNAADSPAHGSGDTLTPRVRDAVVQCGQLHGCGYV
jgi:hypothetical protein